MSKLLGHPVGPAPELMEHLVFEEASKILTHNDCVDHDDPEDAVGAEVSPERLLDEAVLPLLIHLLLSLLVTVVSLSDGLSLPQQRWQKPEEKYASSLK